MEIRKWKTTDQINNLKKPFHNLYLSVEWQYLVKLLLFFGEMTLFLDQND